MPTRSDRPLDHVADVSASQVSNLRFYADTPLDVDAVDGRDTDVGCQTTASPTR
jgi:hypothetical protein